MKRSVYLEEAARAFINAQLWVSTLEGVPLNVIRQINPVSGSDDNLMSAGIDSSHVSGESWEDVRLAMDVILDEAIELGINPEALGYGLCLNSLWNGVSIADNPDDYDSDSHQVEKLERHVRNRYISEFREVYIGICNGEPLVHIENLIPSGRFDV